MFVVDSEKTLDSAFVLLDYYEKGLNSESADFELVLSNFLEVLNAIWNYLKLK